MADIPYKELIDKTRNSNSEVATIEGSTLTWHNEDLVFLQLNLNDIRIIGEFTNSNGPWFDDWFLAFVLKDGTWTDIPFYVKNIEGVLKTLSQRFNHDLKTALVNSTSWKSNVMYPAMLEGQELFKQVPSKNYKKPKNWWQRMLYTFGLSGYDLSMEVELTDNVKALLQDSSSDAIS